MSHVSRRAALQGLGALGLGAVLPIPALARPARRDHHTVSAHTFPVGAATVTIVRDATLALPPSAVGTNVDAELVATLLDEYGLPTENVPTDVSQIVVDVDGTRVLVDTGTGGGELVPTMRSLGIEPASVDRVVISHFHPDHIGGVSQNGEPTFPNASVHISQTELDFLDGFDGDNDAVATAISALAPVRNRIETFTGGAELATGLEAVEAFGHTPGHMAFLLSSGDGRLMIASDTVTHPVAFFRHPEWLFGFDMLPEPTVDTRRELLERAAMERLPFFASHMPFPGVGRVSRDGAGFRFTPTPMVQG
jgi:glyoxylase-like metal-dependent hydrolase (beta-lactamase superfamily II)